MASVCILTQSDSERAFFKLHANSRITHDSGYVSGATCSIQTPQTDPVNFRRCDTYQSASSSTSVNPSVYEVYAAGTGNPNRTTRTLLGRLWELRLQRALRRFQDRVRHRMQRRCELRLFVGLRMQYIYRCRSRIRAARSIQRFVRNKLFLTPGILSPRVIP